ncbi:hypothetical protein BBJ28_00014648 [Nothophytophthora sp. Chile5]|nr:hypothetical protein BBJ28_00014648 [Nothophytophthora sp. Chile5]
MLIEQNDHRFVGLASVVKRVLDKWDELDDWFQDRVIKAIRERKPTSQAFRSLMTSKRSFTSLYSWTGAGGAYISIVSSRHIYITHKRNTPVRFQFVFNSDKIDPNREICAFFFEDQGQGVFHCQLCGASRKQQLRSGYSNLLLHLTSTHPDFEEIVTAAVESDALLTNFGFISEATHQRYMWLQWVVERYLPVSEVDNPLTRSMSCWKPMSSKTIKLDIRMCSKNIGVLLEKEIGDQFGLMWDGWPHAFVHHVAISAVCNVAGKRRERLLSLSPLDEGSQDAEVHIEMFKCMLALYNKDISTMAFLVGDNCSTNQRIASFLELPLVGCASHRYNLAVNRVLVHYESELAGLNSLMVQLRHCNNAAELAKNSPTFEAALAKIATDCKLTPLETRAVQRFAVEPATSGGKRKE